MNPQVKTFQPGQYLFKEGDPSHSMYLLQKGTISVRKTKGSNSYVELARLYSNEVLGELSFFDRLPRSASALALTEVQALELDFDSLDKIYHLIPDYMKAIMVGVADRLRKANETIRRLQKNVVKEGGTGGVFEPGGGDELTSIDDVVTDEQAIISAQLDAQLAEEEDLSPRTKKTK